MTATLYENGYVFSDTLTVKESEKTKESKTTLKSLFTMESRFCVLSKYFQDLTLEDMSEFSENDIICFFLNSCPINHSLLLTIFIRKYLISYLRKDLYLHQEIQENNQESESSTTTLQSLLSPKQFWRLESYFDFFELEDLIQLKSHEIISSTKSEDKMIMTIFIKEKLQPYIEKHINVEKNSLDTMETLLSKKFSSLVPYFEGMELEQFSNFSEQTILESCDEKDLMTMAIFVRNKLRPYLYLPRDYFSCNEENKIPYHDGFTRTWNGGIPLLYKS
jgi:hypothetical protein